MAGYDYFNAASADPFRFGRPTISAQPPIQPGPQVGGNGKPIGAAAAKGDWFDEFMTKQQEQYDKAYNLNQQRYDEGRRLLGLDGGGIGGGNLGYGGTAAGAAPMNAVMMGGPKVKSSPEFDMASNEAKSLYQKLSILNNRALMPNGGADLRKDDPQYTGQQAILGADTDRNAVLAKYNAAAARMETLRQRDAAAQGVTLPTRGGPVATSAFTPSGTTVGGNAGNPGVGVTTGGGAVSGPAYAAQTAPVFQGQIDRGIYNSTAALNQAGVTNSLALSDAARQDQQMQMQMDDRAYRNQQGELDRNERLKAQQLQWIQGANDTYPDQSMLYEVAKMRGQGSQQNIMPDSYLGGGGGGGAVFGNAQSMGYGIPGGSWGEQPTYYQGQTVSAPRQAAKLASLQQNNQPKQFKQPYLNVPGVKYGVDQSPRSIKNFSGLV